MSDFINLSNGLHCCQPAEPHYLRIQSTWCEQKLWRDVLLTVGPDFLYHLATRDSVTVHDVSEKPRVTRALWQGIPWIRYACQRAWGMDPDPVLSRNGMDVTRYWAHQWAVLDGRTRKQVRYFAKFAAPTVAVVDLCSVGARGCAVA